MKKKMIFGVFCIIAMIIVAVAINTPGDQLPVFELEAGNVYSVGFDIPIEAYRVKSISDDIDISIVSEGTIKDVEVSKNQSISLTGIDTIIVNDGNIKLQLSDI